MARTSDPNSATSQFYVNLVNNTGLDYQATDNAGYAVFGKVMDQASLDVVNAIAKLTTKTHSNGFPDWPVTDVTVTAAAVVP
jgi:peptidyl-prolyl cis-trans isomerase A (cyclophilin A)